MMMAIWPGTAPCIRSRCSSSLLIRSDFQDFGFFRVDQPVDLLDVLVGELLDFLLRMSFVVFGDLLQLLDLGERFSAGVPHRDTPFLAQLVNHLDQVLASLLRKCRKRYPDQVTLSRRIEPEIGLADGLLDGVGERLVERLYRQQARLRGGHHGHLVERDVGTVGFHPDDVQQRGAGLAAPDGGELPFGALDRLVHQFPAVLRQFGDGAHRTTVPTPGSPSRTRLMAPDWLMLKTTIGSWLALQRPNAFASMTA